MRQVVIKTEKASTFHAGLFRRWSEGDSHRNCNSRSSLVSVGWPATALESGSPGSAPWFERTAQNR